MKLRARVAWIAGAIAWVAIVAVGIREIHAYTVAEGAHSAAPAMWPATSNLPHVGTTVVMFVHPECPCTRVSMDELADALRVATPATLVFVVEGSTAEVADRLRAFPTARVVSDTGAEAARFGAQTSGHVVAYDASGALRFSGGITAARGHRGDNIGKQSLARVIAGSGPLDAFHAVFGCGLVTR